MYTQCPHCQTCFRIAEEHLKVANGRVRCGSCQEVFDATQHLFKNLTDREPITDFKLPTPAPAPSQPTPPKAAKPKQSNPIQPPSPSPEAVKKVIQERSKAPDQSQFMESLIDNTRYNNLDQMGDIDIPGNFEFGDSIIKYEEELTPPAKPEKPQPGNSPDARTPYEDIESKELPATTADHEVLNNFFAEVDAQLNEETSKSQLDKDIDELLAFAKGLDSHDQLGKDKTTIDEPAPQAPPVEEHNFDLQAIADFEKELEATDSGIFSVEKPKLETSTDKPAGRNEAITTEHKPVAKPEPEFEPEFESAPPKESAKESQPDHEPISTDSQFPQDADIVETLPAPDDDVPRALRRSLAMLDQTPRRSLGKTILLSVLILLLLGGLGFQIVLFRNVELAHMFPKLVPALTQVCNRIPCRYSGQVDVSQIKLINRDVRSDPNQANALLISATFVDKAPFDQPYPEIQITLYDLGGNVVASRRFTPQEYLEKMYNRFLLMESGTPVHITLAVLDPGKDAINFEFSFK